MSNFFNLATEKQIGHIKQLFEQKFSIKAIAHIFDISRSVVVNRLNKCDITPRNRSESMYVRMSQTTFKERQKLTKKANKARKEIPTSQEWFIKQALCKEKSLSKIGKWETNLINNLTKRGIKAIPQKAIGKYNIDVMVANIAVEIHVNTAHPHNYGYYPTRIIYLLNRGINVLYIKITKSFPYSNVCADYLVKFINESRSFPSSFCEYRVIRGNGDFIARRCLNSDKSSLIEPPC